VDDRAGGEKNDSLGKIKFSVTLLLIVNTISKKTVASYSFTSPAQHFTSFQEYSPETNSSDSEILAFST
jgi:hypothetical protein